MHILSFYINYDAIGCEAFTKRAQNMLNFENVIINFPFQSQFTFSHQIRKFHLILSILRNHLTYFEPCG